MKPRYSPRPLALVAGLTLATLLPAWAPAAAAPIFGPAETAALSCTPDGSNPVTGTLQATAVNDGRGLVLSGAATSTGVGVICMELNWFGSLTGSIDASNSVPVAFDYSIDFSGPASLVTSTVAVSLFHEAYMVGPFTQGGFGFSAPMEGIGQILSAPDLALEWPGPADGSTRAFTSYVATLQVLARADGANANTLSVSIPASTSIDLGQVRRSSVPEADMAGLLALALLAAVRRRRVRS